MCKLNPCVCISILFLFYHFLAAGIALPPLENKQNERSRARASFTSCTSAALETPVPSHNVTHYVFVSSPPFPHPAPACSTTERACACGRFLELPLKWLRVVCVPPCPPPWCNRWLPPCCGCVSPSRPPSLALLSSSSGWTYPACGRGGQRGRSWRKGRHG